DNLLIGLQFSNEQTETDELLNDLLENLSLHYSLDTKASDLSGGEQQRVALGRVLLMKEAEVYLLDEPSSALDNQTAKQVMNEFINKAKENKQQVIMVTHDEQIQEEFAEEVINMDEYSIQLQGDQSG